jgi:FKBP-type peptidyl-prolyl cis-trans isomerase
LQHGSGLTIEEADELSVEDMIEEHCEELQDEEVDTGLGNNNNADSAAAEPKKKKEAAKQTKQKKSTVSGEGQGSPEATKESEKWKPQSILTEWGRTDDVVTIGNGDQYYYFKIPHKAI